MNKENENKKITFGENWKANFIGRFMEKISYSADISNKKKDGNHDFSIMK